MADVAETGTVTHARGRDLVVIAASAGGVEALRCLMSKLPPTLPAAVLVVLHVPPEGGRALPKILTRAGKLPAVTATEGEELRPGQVYVSPPDRHMLVIDDKIQLSRGPRHNGHQPAADPLFISAALTAGPRTIAVVLSGTLDDGAAGSVAVDRRGGAVLVQDPAESAYDGMPQAALSAVSHARPLRLGEMAAVIEREAQTPLPDATVEPDTWLERQLSAFLAPVPSPAAAPAGWDWSGVSCPECGGPLRQENGAVPVRFECPAGHAWSPESLIAAQASGIERALWAAVLRLEERARLNHVLSETAGRQGYPVSAGGFLSTARAAESGALEIRRLLGSSGASGAAAPDTGDG
jgi:two-component system, chemotaxis family, protein-glutamate methylesterase/glutaminase